MLASIDRKLKLGTLILTKHARCFSSQGPASPHQLIVNSTSTDIVFVDGMSILFLPPLDLVEPLYDSEGDLVENDSPFFDHLGKILSNLDSGDQKLYRFDFYFYVDSSLLMDVYTVDFYNKNRLNLVKGSFGYFKFISITVELKVV